MATPVVRVAGRGARVPVPHVTKATATVNTIPRLGVGTVGVQAAVAVLVLTTQLTCINSQ